MPAIAQPTSRGPTAEFGAATATGRTKTRRTAVDAVAIVGDTIPANRTANPMTAIVTTAAILWVEATVPSEMRTAPITKTMT